ncbi:hypothetical protein MMYC01_209316 [Madurella mycetomatis]|uniref:Uncharacterized protein n=1 Tax=Madurella mycetomatis TaxID=100816 RepID=A0A175VU30_9PEZI|nr:hypothetical protein MMYC01_209316 [Madurella mycetomatis]
MDHLSRMSHVGREFDVAVSDAESSRGASGPSSEIRSPAPKTRSLSDGGGTPGKLSPSPHIVEAARRQSKDDIAIRDKEHEVASSLPSTPIRAGFSIRGLSLQMPQRDSAASPAQQGGYVRPAPLSPKLDHSHIYASPTNILPRRSRGLDFSRAATSLHHSTLADQASPDSSPTIGSRAMNIPGRRGAEYGTAEQTSTSLWSMMGNQERMHISSSVGSTSHALSDLSSSSDDDDFMDEDMDEAYVTTPQVPRMGMPGSSGAVAGTPWMPGSPAANSLLSFQQRQRQRKQSKKKARGPFGLGFHSPAAPGVMPRSPPNNLVGPKDLSLPHTRRESISWAANQLHISGNESDDSINRQLEGVDSPSRPSVVRRAVTRRGNLLPKTKGFARIRAALAEECAPVEAEFRREAEVVRQVRESDMDLEPRQPPAHSAATTALSSPNLATHDSLDEISEDIMMMDPSGSALGLAGTFKQQALKNSKGKVFWDTFSDGSSSGAAPRVTPPPPYFSLARASSSGLSLEDVSMDSPSASSNGGGTSQSQSQNPFVVPHTTASSSGNGTPQPAATASQSGGSTAAASAPVPVPGHSHPHYHQHQPPSAAEITRRINSKRRRDDDLDPVSIKRRAVSPGMSVHNSPILQSPLQRDMAPWGPNGAGSSRPGSVGGDGIGKAGGGSGGSGAPSESGSSNGGRHLGGGGKGRVGFQGMVDTNDGITKLCIE